jgi:hypothetical protein
VPQVREANLGLFRLALDDHTPLLSIEFGKGTASSRAASHHASLEGLQPLRDGNPVIRGRSMQNGVYIGK